MHKIVVPSLEEMRQKYLDLMLDQFPRLEPVDYVMLLIISSFLNRAISLNRGFLSLEADNNYLSAIPLVRMQIDNCVRLSAIYRMPSFEDYQRWILSEEPLSKQFDKDTHAKLTDTYMLDKLEEKYPNIKPLYKLCSGYVHFSEQIIKYTASSEEGTRRINVRVGEMDEFSPEAKKNIRVGMEYANKILYTTASDILSQLINNSEQSR